MENSVFDSEGTVVFGYTLFALGLAAAIGVVWRRAVPALVVAFAGYFAARIFVDTWLRQRLVSPLSKTFPRDERGRASTTRGCSTSFRVTGSVIRRYTSPLCPPGADKCAMQVSGRRPRLHARDLPPAEPLLAAAV